MATIYLKRPVEFAVFPSLLLMLTLFRLSLNVATIGYGRTFNLAGRQANVAVVVPYIWGTAKGTVFEDQVFIRTADPSDPDHSPKCI